MYSVKKNVTFNLLFFIDIKCPNQMSNCEGPRVESALTDEKLQSRTIKSVDIWCQIQSFICA